MPLLVLTQRIEDKQKDHPNERVVFDIDNNLIKIEISLEKVVPLVYNINV